MKNFMSSLLTRSSIRYAVALRIDDPLGPETRPGYNQKTPICGGYSLPLDSALSTEAHQSPSGHCPMATNPRHCAAIKVLAVRRMQGCDADFFLRLV
jgi:hypothetical protein